tara:strand:- start:286 stop:870 length:585 start_codon:yes stop_codon:yes gene_type:complete
MDTKAIEYVCNTLKKNPELYYTDAFSALKEVVDNIKYEEESDEEEAPPKFMESKADKIRQLIDESKACVQEGNYKLGLEKCDEALRENPDSVKSLRSRAFIYSHLELYKYAHTDICKAQSIDFSEDFVEFENKMKEMKGSHDKSKSESKASKFDNTSIQELLNNKQFCDMANDMMKNPELMQTISNMSDMFRQK